MDIKSPHKSDKCSVLGLKYIVKKDKASEVEEWTSTKRYIQSSRLMHN